MTLSIHTNVASEYVSRNINRYSSAFIKTIGRIGSGEQIQSAADDAAGLALSSKLKVNIRSWQKTIQTISSGIDMLKTAEDALVSQSEALTKMKSLVLQGANGLLTNSDKDNINNELSELLKSINEISNNSIFNGQNILQNIKTEGSYTYTDQTGALSDINATSMTINSNNPITLGTHKLEVTGIDAIITNIDTSGIVGEIESAYGPKWGDNNTLYFIMNDNDGGNALYSINKNGSGLTKVTGPIGGSGIREFDVSQQGYIAVILENGDVYAKRGGTVFTQVATNSLSANDGISWNAAGDKFVYRGTTITQLHIYDFNTSTNTTLNLGSAVNNPFWNWSDNKIYYRVFASGAGRIGSINPDGSGQNNSTYNLAGGDYWPTLRNGNFASGSTINMDASSIIYSNQGANFSGYNPEISPDGTLIASIVPTTAGNTNNIQIHTIAGAVSQASINDNSLKNSLFNVSPYIAANADVGTDIYTFTYSESSNTWTVKNSDNVTIDSGLSGGTLYNVGNLGLMVNIKNITRLRDGDTFTISTETL
ncbi:MAG TPA: hypothetical protein PLM75_11535, partial [bacterium]|nr:hypothetical protein [bacterium]